MRKRTQKAHGPGLGCSRVPQRARLKSWVDEDMARQGGRYNIVAEPRAAAWRLCVCLAGLRNRAPRRRNNAIWPGVRARRESLPRAQLVGCRCACVCVQYARAGVRRAAFDQGRSGRKSDGIGSDRRMGGCSMLRGKMRALKARDMDEWTHLCELRIHLASDCR